MAAVHQQAVADGMEVGAELIQGRLRQALDCAALAVPAGMCDDISVVMQV